MINLKNLVVSLILWLFIFEVHSQSWTNGTIVSWEGDSTSIDMFVDKKARVDRYYSYLDVIVRSKSEEVDTLTATDIRAYEKEGIVYISNKSFNSKMKSDYFLKEIVSSGGVNLYYSWGRVNEDKKDLYYFRKENEDWYKMDVDKGTVFPDGVNYSESPSSLYIKKNPNAYLKRFFSDYFSDCDYLIRVLESEVIAANNIKNIFKFYVNNCATK